MADCDEDDEDDEDFETVVAVVVVVVATSLLVDVVDDKAVFVGGGGVDNVMAAVFVVISLSLDFVVVGGSEAASVFEPPELDLAVGADDDGGIGNDEEEGTLPLDRNTIERICR